MSQANNGQYEEMVQNHVCRIFFANTFTKLKQKAQMRILGQHLMFWGLLHIFKTTNSAGNQEKRKKIAPDSQH